jgi:hypothetical protein
MFWAVLLLSIVWVIKSVGDPMSDLEATIKCHGGQVLRATDREYRLAATLWNTAIQVSPGKTIHPTTYEDATLVLLTLSSLDILEGVGVSIDRER